MGKLTDKLKAKHADRGGRNRHRVTFLAHKADIVEAIREGWSAMQIWQQMTEDGQISMCYSTFCTHVRREIPDATGETKPADAKEKPVAPPAGSRGKLSEKPVDRIALEELTEDERLEALKNEAFAKVRSKPVGPLITHPKTREEELRELFGDSAPCESDTLPS